MKRAPGLLRLRLRCDRLLSTFAFNVNVRRYSKVDTRAELPPQWELGCRTKLKVRVQVPRPLSLAPSFVIGGAFSVISGAVMQAGTYTRPLFALKSVSG